MSEVKSPGKWRQVRRNAGKVGKHGDRWEVARKTGKDGQVIGW